MLSRSEKNRRRKFKLWSENPHCFWCGILTIFQDTKNWGAGDWNEKRQDNWATLDHLRCRLDDTRHDPKLKNEERTVLSCWKCNNERNKKEMGIAGIEKLRSKSGNEPATREKLIEIINNQRLMIKKMKRTFLKLNLKHVYNEIVKEYHERIVK